MTIASVEEDLMIVLIVQASEEVKGIDGERNFDHKVIVVVEEVSTVEGEGGDSMVAAGVEEEWEEGAEMIDRSFRRMIVRLTCRKLMFACRLRGARCPSRSAPPDALA